MASVLSIPEQAYTPRTINLSQVLSVNATSISVLLSRVGWPVGKVLSVEIKFPDGSSAGTVAFDGGVVVRHGATVLNSAIGIRSESGLPLGTYSLVVTVVQTITTAIIVDVT